MLIEAGSTPHAPEGCDAQGRPEPDSLRDCGLQSRRSSHCA